MAVRLPVSKEEIDELQELQIRFMTFDFSCEPSMRVFMPIGDGYTHPPQRVGRYVDHRVTNFIAGVVKTYDPNCGRFYVREEGAYLSRDDRFIVEFLYDY